MRKKMRTTTLALASATTAILIVSSLLPLSARGREEKRPRGKVLVELFTSEGCSSCPRAEALLPELRHAVPGVEVVALAFHVDYWDHLGWKDRFSSAAYSSRQRSYAESLGDGVFTPQLVIDGSVSVVGSDRRGALRQITDRAARPKGELAVQIQETDVRDGMESVHITVVGELPEHVGRADRARVFLAVAEDGLISDIAHGENAGRQLREEAVVRELIPLGAPAAGGRVEKAVALRLKPDWTRSRLRYAAFIQARDTRAVLAVGQATHPAE